MKPPPTLLMNVFTVGRILVALLLALAFGAGCNRTTPPPAPLAVEELPAAIDQAFAKAKPEAKAMARQVVELVQTQHHPQAFAALQALAASPELTKEQQSVVSRATLTVNGLLQAAQSKGDEQAAQTLQNYRTDK